MLVGRSAVMQELRVRVARVAKTNFTVLIEGESGAGKELVAHELHERSPRARGPFVAVNCAALVETLVEAELFGIEERTATGVRGRRGKFEQADQGTLFLDEVADLSPMAQAKLLRVLQDLSIERVGGQYARQVDVRVVAATNRSLGALVQAGRFRPDLYYRLGGVELHVPPLRARRSDIPLLVDHFVMRHRRTRSVPISIRAVEALVAYDWPGNVRQLGRVIERAVALAPGPCIEIGDFPPEISKDYREVAGRAGRPRRIAARVVQPLRTAGARALSRQQAPRVRRARHQLPHAAGAPGLRHRRPAGLSPTGALRGAGRAGAADGRLLTRGRTTRARSPTAGLPDTRRRTENMRITPLHFAIAAATAALLSASPAIAETPAPKGIVQRVKDPGTGLEVRVQQDRPGTVSVEIGDRAVSGAPRAPRRSADDDGDCGRREDQPSRSTRTDCS